MNFDKFLSTRNNFRDAKKVSGPPDIILGHSVCSRIALYWISNEFLTKFSKILRHFNAHCARMLQIRKWKNVKKEQKYVIFGPYLTSREHPIGQIPHCMILNQYSIHLKTPGKIWSRLLDNKPKSKPRTLLGLFSPILASKMSIFRSKFWFIIISGSFRRHRTCIMAPIRFQMFFNGLLDVYKSIWVIIFEHIRPKIHLNLICNI